MKYCKKCIQPDSRPAIHLNEEGVCGACLYEKKKSLIDWDSKHKELTEIAKWAKKTTKGAYDCAIGVSGGKDSTLQALYARDKLGLRPLLVNSEPEGLTSIGSSNIENLKRLGFDLISIRPNPVVMKKLVKKSFYDYGNPAKITEYSLTASTYIISEKFQIPLLIQGESDADILGVANAPAANNALNMNKLDTQSTPLEEFMIDGVTEKDLFFFHYDAEKMIEGGFKGIWLQQYFKEWSNPNNAQFAVNNGLKIRPIDSNPYTYGTYTAYSQIDCDIWTMNNMLKYLKFGYGQCTDHANIDIRAGLISREEAIELVKRYDGQCSALFIKEFCDYIDITEDEFWRVANHYRGPMWEKMEDGNWDFKDSIWKQQPSNIELDINKLTSRLYPKASKSK